MGAPTMTERRATALVLASVLSVQLGAALSKHLFDQAGPLGMVWLRVAFASVVLLVVARPRIAGRSRADWIAVLGYGLALAGMNLAIYESFARIPLGIAVTIEFLGPLGVALAGALTSANRGVNLIWVGLAGLGVLLLGVERAQLSSAGVALAMLAGLMWAAYIPLSVSVGRRWPGLSGLAVASCVGAVGLAPGAVVVAGDALLRPEVLVVGALVGVLSSVIPYSCELIALRVLEQRVFGVLMSLDPAGAALAGLVVLGERLGLVQWAAIGCVVVASIGVTGVGRGREGRTRRGESTAAAPVAPDRFSS
jgi:inner membrane transporter RhtA